MKLFSLLFDSFWRQKGDELSKARQNRHYDSMAGQVMANRNEMLHLQGELDRLSQDLAQAMTLNRVLVKVLVEEGVCTPETLEQVLKETLTQSELELGENETPSRFCENCGRPLSHPGRTCPYCTELSFEETPPDQAETSEPVEDSEAETELETSDEDTERSDSSEPADKKAAKSKKSAASKDKSSKGTGKKKKRRSSKDK